MAHADPVAPLVLTLDIGSSSTRALLFDASGAPVQGAGARAAYELRTTADGGAELDADRMVLRVAACLDELLLEAGALAGQIGAVALDTFVGNILGVDAGGAAVTPVYTWADTRSGRWAARLRGQIDPAATWQRTGCPIHNSYLPARLLWLANDCPDLFARASRWQTFGEYLASRLTGQPLLSTSVASWNGLLNRQTCDWDAELLAALPISAEQLGRPVDVRAAHTGLLPEYAARWPALANVPWLPPIGDGAGSNLGCGAANARFVAINLGTSGALRVVVPQVETVPAGLWCYRVDRSRELLGGALSNGGNVFGWAEDTLLLGDLAVAERRLQEAAPASHGLTVLPFLAGERSPGYADYARATLDGLSLHTTPLAIVQALMEAVAYTFGELYDRLRPLLAADHQILVSGGALLNSAAWQQMVCDVLGRPILISKVDEATARGTALLALEALGVIGDLADLPPPVADTRLPDAARHAIHSAARERQRALYRTLVESRLPPSLL